MGGFPCENQKCETRMCVCVTSHDVINTIGGCQVVPMDMFVFSLIGCGLCVVV